MSQSIVTLTNIYYFLRAPTVVLASNKKRLNLRIKQNKVNF